MQTASATWYGVKPNRKPHPDDIATWLPYEEFVCFTTVAGKGSSGDRDARVHPAEENYSTFPTSPMHHLTIVDALRA